jgi:hypothetical protein
LFDAAARGLHQLPNVSETDLPRMADFARFGEAVSRAPGCLPGQFLTTYRKNRKGAAESAIDDSLVAGAILRLIDRDGAWAGTAKDLLGKLTAIVDEKVVESKQWPRSPRGISGAVKKVAPALRLIGMNVDSGRGHDRFITIERAPARKVGETPTQPAQPTQITTPSAQPQTAQADTDVDFCAGPAPVENPTDATGAPTDATGANRRKTGASEVPDPSEVTPSGADCAGLSPDLLGGRVRDVY